MIRSDAEMLIDGYEKLLAKALKILGDDGPPWGFVWTPEWARVNLDGDEVVVSWPKDESSYDSTSIEREETRFPAALLFMETDELAKWKKAAKAEYDESQRKIRERELKRIADVERAEYARLQAKFGQR